MHQHFVGGGELSGQSNQPAVASRARFERADFAIFAALTALHIAALGIVFTRVLSGSGWSELHPFFYVLLATLLVYLVLWESRWFSLPLMRVPEPRPAADGWRVGVAVTFVPGAESLEMLERSVAALVAMNYPHDTWVLDEGDDVEVYDLCRRYGARHFSRAGRAQYQQASGPFKAATKYGNYNAWLHDVGYDAYDIVVAFDSDHVPKAEYLAEVLGYFDQDDVGYVQPAQAYYNQRASFIARAAAEETYAYFSSIQMSAFGVGYPIIVGCHNAHRVTALRDIGGFAEHEADDLVMTLQYRAHGWRGVYVPKILARGLTPTSWIAYLRQQRRWARSVLDYKLRVFPRHSSRLPMLERLLTYVHGVYYLRGPIVALQLAILSLMLAFSVVPGGTGASFLLAMGSIWFTMMAAEAFRQRFYLDPQTERGLHWRAAFVAFVKWPYFILAFMDALRGRYGEYTLTPKAVRSPLALGFGTVHVIVGAVVTLAWLVNLLSGPSAFIPIHLAAAGAIIASLAAATTATWRFAPPFPSRRRVSQRAEIELPRKVAVERVPLAASSVQPPVRRPEITSPDWGPSVQAS